MRITKNRAQSEEGEIGKMQSEQDVWDTRRAMRHWDYESGKAIATMAQPTKR